MIVSFTFTMKFWRHVFFFLFCCCGVAWFVDGYLKCGTSLLQFYCDWKRVFKLHSRNFEWICFIVCALRKIIAKSSVIEWFYVLRCAFFFSRWKHWILLSTLYLNAICVYVNWNIKKNNVFAIDFNFNFTEAEAYINLLQTEGVNKPVDVDADSCTIQLPDWYDANLFKRCVSIYLFKHT